MSVETHAHNIHTIKVIKMKLTVDLSNPEDIGRALDFLNVFCTESVNTVQSVPAVELYHDEAQTVPKTHDSTTAIVDARTDKHGRMYDARIDSSNRELLKDGEWCKRRKPKDMTDSQWLQYRAKVMSEYEPATTEDVSSLFGVTTPAATEQVENDIRSLFGEQPTAITYEALSEKLVCALMDNFQPYFTSNTVASACASCQIPNLAAAKNDPDMLAKLNRILFPS
jgi:hypothetical protein